MQTLGLGSCADGSLLNQSDHFPVTLRERLSLAGKLSIQELASCGASLDSHASFILGCVTLAG